MITHTRRTHLGRQEFLQAAAEHLQQEWREGHHIKSCPVFFNITNFHLYNAAHGFRRGDLCLQHIENILQEVFPCQLVVHLGSDTFAVLADTADVQVRIDTACQRVLAFIGNPNIALKAGIRFLTGLPSTKDLNVTFDSEAKIACDTIKKDASRHWAVYTEELGLRHQMQNYVREHLDQAMAKGYIRVYLQPVVRTLTGELVSAEALARWESPQYGTIAPGIFIPVLEEAHLIHKLDAYILHTVAKMAREKLDANLPVLPISVNLSRLDFLLQDPFAVAETIREEYRLPLGLIQIEVTENALVDRMDSVLNGIQKFQKKGYPVLLDDFGSGYSSLNVLKDYDFDTIKFDMKFLHPFTAKSRKILKYLVSMAKDLSVHTLAEGAETKDQCDFLREIGCEKIQGYYYGKPVPCEDFQQYCLDNDLHLEIRDDTELLNKAGLVDMNQTAPVAILYDDNEQMTMLQANALYLDALHSIGTPSVERVNINFRSKNFPMNEKFRRFLERGKATGQWESMMYVDNGQYMRVKIKELAARGTHSVHQLHLSNISADKAFDDTHSHRFDTIVRNVLQTYDAIWYINLDQDVIEIIEPLTETRVGMQFHDTAATMQRFASRYVHPADRERFLAFAAPAALYERASTSPKSFITAPFRILMSDGHYVWIFFTSMALFKSTSREMLICFNRNFIEQIPDRTVIIRQMLESYGIAKDFFAAGQDPLYQGAFATMLEDMDVEFFWKDRQHRFCGASRAFLKARGVRDIAEIRGRTDKELGWQLLAEQAYETEETVMRTGTPLLGVREQIDIGHRLQEIRAAKFPIRQDGQVIGIFIKLSTLVDAPARREQDAALGLIDEETHLLSYCGMLRDALLYADEYRLHGNDYTATLLDVPEFDGIGMKYGKDFRRHLLQKIVALLHKDLPAACSIARVGSCCFIILSKNAQDNGLQEAALRITQEVHAIREVDGHPCTLYMHYAKAHGAEVRSLDSLMRLLIQRLQRAEEKRYGLTPYSNDNLLFSRDLFDTLPFGVIISDPATHELLYLNQAQRRELGLTYDEPLAGKTCYRLLMGANAPCDNCNESKLRHNVCQVHIYHNDTMNANLLLCHTLVPWNGKSCHFCMAINLDKYQQRHAAHDKVLYQELSINDIIRAGMYEIDPESGIRKMMNRLGHLLSADHLLIAEETATMLRCSHFWDAQDALPLSREIQPFPREEIHSLYEHFLKEPVFTIDDVEAFCRDNGYAPRLPNLQRLIFVRLRLDDRAYGYLEVINPAPEQMEKALPLLQALARFFSILLRNRNLIRHIDRLGKIDPLTAIMNRRGLLDYLQNLPDNRQYAFFFGDLNGLKETNDRLGHEAGDTLIKAAASLLESACPTDAVFRMGGDEFLMVEEIQDSAQAGAICAQLHDRFRTAGISIALGYALATTPIDNIDTILATADRHMYQEKIQHHQTRHQHIDIDN